MAWRIDYDPRAIADLRRLSREIRREIADYLDERIAPLDNPRILGKALRHEFVGLWRYRVRDYRIVCEIRDQTSVVLVIGVGHRRDIYR